jgi:hypothetical protein
MKKGNCEQEQKKRTMFETAVVNELKKLSNVYDVKRIALSGAKDKGDIEFKCGTGKSSDCARMIECKNVKNISPKMLDNYKEQTLKEKANGEYKNAYLIVKKHGSNIDYASVYIPFVRIIINNKTLWACYDFKDFKLMLNDFLKN